MIELSTILGRPELGLLPIHVPHPNQPIRWVATSELSDPAPYLEGGEVLLSTGLGTSDWHSEWEEYVVRLLRADVAALGLGVELTHPRAPAALIEASRQHELNLFEVPRSTAFVAISRVTAALLENARATAARQALGAQQALTQAALRNDDISALIDQLADLVGGAVAIVNNDCELVAGPSGPRIRSLDLALVKAEVVRLRPQQQARATVRARQWSSRWASEPAPRPGSRHFSPDHQATSSRQRSVPPCPC